MNKGNVYPPPGISPTDKEADKKDEIVLLVSQEMLWMLNAECMRKDTVVTISSK